MKIALPDLPFAYLKGISSTLKTLEDYCDIDLFIWNSKKPLMDVLDEVKPDIAILYQHQANIALDVAAESFNFNYIAITSSPLQLKKQPIAYITDKKYTANFLNYQNNTLTVKPSANVAQIHNGRVSEILQSDICIFNNDIQLGIEHSKIFRWLTTNYNTKIFGPQKVEYLQYLGDVNIFERADAIASSKVCIDLGNFDCLDSSYLKVAPLVLNGDNPLYKNFKSIEQLEQVVNPIIDHPKDRNKYCKTLYEDVIKNKTFYHRVAEIFTVIGDQTRANQCLNKLKELVS
jgi:hypothetical protein